MINEIISGISRAIYAEFGDGYEIYKESIEQGLQEPCFSILCIAPSMKHFRGDRYRQQHEFCIHYFPSTKTYKECFQILERLIGALEYMTVDNDLIRGGDMRGEVVGDVLYFFLKVDFFTYKETVKDDPMGNYEVNTQVRKEEDE